MILSHPCSCREGVRSWPLPGPRHGLAGSASHRRGGGTGQRPLGCWPTTQAEPSRRHSCTPAGAHLRGGATGRGTLACWGGSHRTGTCTANDGLGAVVPQPPHTGGARGEQAPPRAVPNKVAKEGETRSNRDRASRQSPVALPPDSVTRSACSASRDWAPAASRRAAALRLDSSPLSWIACGAGVGLRPTRACRGRSIATTLPR